MHVRKAILVPVQKLIPINASSTLCSRIVAFEPKSSHCADARTCRHADAADTDVSVGPPFWSQLPKKAEGDEVVEHFHPGPWPWMWELATRHPQLTDCCFLSGGFKGLLGFQESFNFFHDGPLVTRHAQNIALAPKDERMFHSTHTVY